MTALEPIGIIINPFSGRKRWKSAEMVIDQSFNFNSRKVKVFKSKKIYELTCQLSGWANLIIVVGGDGSLNSAAKAIVNTDSNPTLLFVPTGTANDMAYNLKLPNKIEEVISLISKGSVKKIDLGTVNTLGKKEVFTNVFGLSASVELIQRFKELEDKSSVRAFSYLGTAWKSFWESFSNPEINVKIEFKKSRLWKSKKSSTLCLVSNGKRCGRFFKLAPKAKMNDGLLDFCFSDKIFRFNMPENLVSFITGSHISRNRVETVDDYLPQVKGIEFTLAEPRNYQVDGDIMEAKKYFYVKVLEKRLKVLTPN